MTRWPIWLINSVFLLKGLNSFIITWDWWKEKVYWHVLFDDWAYERFWYFTFTYRRYEMVVPAILLVYEKSTKRSAMNGYSYLLLLAFYLYEMAEYWLINNDVNKVFISVLMAVFIFLTSYVTK